MDFEGKSVLITGAGSRGGIGAATAHAFARDGASVVITGRNAERGAEVVDDITAGGGKARFILADLSELADVEPRRELDALEPLELKRARLAVHHQEQVATPAQRRELPRRERSARQPILLLHQGGGPAERCRHTDRLAQQHHVALRHTAHDRARSKAGQHMRPNVVGALLAPEEAVRHDAAAVSERSEPNLGRWAHDAVLPR